MITAIRPWLAIGLITIIASFGIIGVVGFNLGIDFTGGSLMVINGPAQSPTQVSGIIQQELGISATVSLGEAGDYFIRTAELTPEQYQALLTALTAEGIFQDVLRYESIGPTIGAELTRKAWQALLLVSLTVIVYLMYIFRETSGLIAGWKFGLAALYALVHDLATVTALFVVLGATVDVVIDTLFVTAMLSLLGFSVNDTIVIFDRFRRDWLAGNRGNLLTVLDKAVRVCLTRSLNISFAILLVLGALLVFGGDTIRWFVVALIAGTIVGTYSSLFVAPPMLYYLSRRS